MGNSEAQLRLWKLKPHPLTVQIFCFASGNQWEKTWLQSRRSWPNSSETAGEPKAQYCINKWIMQSSISETLGRWKWAQGLVEAAFSAHLWPLSPWHITCPGLFMFVCSCMALKQLPGCFPGKFAVCFYTRHMHAHEWMCKLKGSVLNVQLAMCEY